MSNKREQTANRTILFSIIGNTLLAAAKWIVGFLGNSYAIIADAIESTTDIVSSLVVWGGLKYANRPPDKNHPYGHGKAEPLVTFILVLFLVFSAILIAWQAIQNIMSPDSAPKPFTLIFLACIIAIKEFFYHRVKSRGEEVGSSSLAADAWHHRSDAITSLAAFIGISAALIMGEGYESADDWAALVASGMILYNSYHIFRPALGEVMDEQMHSGMIARIRELAPKVDGVVDTETCHIRKNGLLYYVDLHVIVPADMTVQKSHEIAHLLKDKIMNDMEQVADVLIHIEPDEE